MAEHWWNWSSSPYADGQQPPAEHSEDGQRTGEFNIDDVTGTDNDWDAESDGGLAVEFIGSGLNGNMTRLYHDSGLGSTIRDGGPDYEVVDRVFRGDGGQGSAFNAFTVLRQHGTGNNHYLLGIRETSGGALDINIIRMSDGQEKALDGTVLASQELGSDHDTAFPIDTEGWIRARAEDDPGNSNTQLKVKFWTGSAGDEPSGWDLETTDDEYYDTKGYIGIAVVRGEQYYDVRGVGTGGDSAPTEDPDAGGADVSGSGSPQATTASSDGDLGVTVSFSGTLQASRSTATGESDVIVGATGNPQAVTATGDGEGSTTDTTSGSGSPQASTATSTGTLVARASITGTVTADRAIVTGEASVEISGDGDAQAATATTDFEGGPIVKASGDPQAETATSEGGSDLPQIVFTAVLFRTKDQQGYPDSLVTTKTKLGNETGDDPNEFSIGDLWHRFLDLQAIPDGTLNDRMHMWLTQDKGVSGDSLNDLLANWDGSL